MATAEFSILAVREMQVKTTMRNHLTSVRMDIINRTTNNKCWRGCGEREPSSTVGVNVNYIATVDIP